jgi:hypothetical protein
MKTVEIKLYKFSELSEEAKQRAIEKLYDINVNYDWWECIYTDAESIGCEINGFDIDRGSECSLSLKWTAFEVADAIVKSHGEQCETYQTAIAYLQEYDELVAKHSDGKNLEVVAEDKEYDFDCELDELEQDFQRSLSEDYFVILRNNYEYLTEEEAIIETIEANEYDFTEDGKLY